MRLPLGVGLTGLAVLLLAGLSATFMAVRTQPTWIDAFGTHLLVALPGQAPAPTPAAGAPVRVRSKPAGAGILVGGQVLGRTSATSRFHPAIAWCCGDRASPT